MTPLETLALSKVVPKKEASAARNSVPPGPGQEVDFVVHVKGTMNVAEDSTMLAVQSAKPWLLLAAALSKLNGVTVEALVREADLIPKAEQDKLKASVTTALAKIKGKTETKRRGTVTTKLVAERIVTTNKLERVA